MSDAPLAPLSDAPSLHSREELAEAALPVAEPLFHVFLGHDLWFVNDRCHSLAPNLQATSQSPAPPTNCQSRPYLSVCQEGFDKPRGFRIM